MPRTRRNCLDNDRGGTQVDISRPCRTSLFWIRSALVAPFSVISKRSSAKTTKSRRASDRRTRCSRLQISDSSINIWPKLSLTGSLSRNSTGPTPHCHIIERGTMILIDINGAPKHVNQPTRRSCMRSLNPICSGRATISRLRNPVRGLKLSHHRRPLSSRRG